MAYYTVSHYMQGDPWGSKPGSLDIDHKDLNDATWDFIFAKGDYNPDQITIPKDKLEKCR